MKYVLKPRPVPEVIYKNLDEEQKNAVVNSKGRSIVIAGPGSGKTRVITYKIVHLISQGVSPSEIMLVTFTRAAAKEMIDRIRSVTGRDLSDMTAGTFHSVSNAILRKYAKLLGYESNYTILDKDDAKTLMGHARSTVLEKLPLDVKKAVPRPEPLLSIHSYSMNTLCSIEEAVRKKNPKFFSVIDVIKDIFQVYSEEKIRQNVMDYDDLLVNLLRLLEENPEIEERLSSRYRWILVDEFQDTNIVQYEIIERLSKVHGNVFVVGDDAQSIYSFRGARFENVEDFINRGNTLVFKIQTNYRSTDKIVDLINRMIPRRAVEKKLRAVRKGTKKPVLVETFDENEQTMFVVQKIEELVSDGVSPNDIAVLYRSHNLSMRLQLELATRRIPHKILSGLRFTETAHVKDVLAFLKIIQNPLDMISWMRASKLFSGVGEATASKVAKRVASAIEEGKDYLESLRGFRGRASEGISKLGEVLRALRKEEKPSEMIDTVLEEFYMDHLEYTYENARERIEDLRILSDIASKYESLERFLSDITTAEDVGPALRDDSEDKITLSTVHQAKGLEWKVVFVISVNHGDFPNYLALKEGNLDEEERLFYVAITRAKDELYIVYQALGSKNPYIGNSIAWSRGQSFVERIPEDLVEFWEVE